MIPFAMATSFNSDEGTWTSNKTQALGDFLVSNLGKTDPRGGNVYNQLGVGNPTRTVLNDPDSLSIVKRYQTTATDTLKLNTTLATTFTSYEANVVYIGNHNLPEGTTITMKCYQNTEFGSPLYTVSIPWHPTNIFFFRDVVKAPGRCYVFDFTLPTEQVIKIGRLVVSECLKFDQENELFSDITYGYKHYKTEVVTEAKYRASNSHAFVKTLNLGFKFDIERQDKLNNQIQMLIKQGIFNRPIIIIPFKNEPNRASIYGVLTELPRYEQEYYGRVSYFFDIEEVI